MHEKRYNSSPLTEALNLTEEALKNIELNEISLTSIALKIARICRLLDLENYRKIFEYEISGYPSPPGGIVKEVWDLGIIAGRITQEKEEDSDEIKTLMYTGSIESLEHDVVYYNNELSIIQNDKSPNQQYSIFYLNQKNNLLKNIKTSQKHLSARRFFIYKFCLDKYYELKFSDQVGSLFDETRLIVDKNISKVHPEGLKKLTSMLNNLKSNNSEDWSNAVHSCRRLLQEIADKIYPPSDKDKILESGKSIKLGPENYINRLVCFVEENLVSKTYAGVMNSEIKFTGERLDALFQAGQKGSHNSVTQYEAERYVIYTYLLIGEILNLKTDVTVENTFVKSEVQLDGKK